MKSKHYIKKYNLSSGKGFDHSSFVFDLASDFYSSIEWYKSSGDFSEKKFWQAVSEIETKYNSIFNRAVTPMPEKLWGYFYATTIKTAFFELFPHLEELSNNMRNMPNSWLSEYITAHTDYQTRCFIRWNNDPSVHEMKREINSCYDELNSHGYGFHIEVALKVYIHRLKSRTGQKLKDEEAEHRKWKEQQDKKREQFRKLFGNMDFDPFFYSIFGGMFERMMRERKQMAKPVESFKILGISEDATEEDMKKAFRTLVFKYRQDRGNTPDKDKFTAVMEAKSKCEAYFKLKQVS